MPGESAADLRTVRRTVCLIRRARVRVDRMFVAECRGRGCWRNQPIEDKRYWERNWNAKLELALIRRLRSRAEPRSIPPRSSTPKSTSLDKRDPANPIAFLICLQRPQYAFGTVPVSPIRASRRLHPRRSPKKRSTLQIHKFASAEFFFAEGTGLADDQVNLPARCHVNHVE